MMFRRESEIVRMADKMRAGRSVFAIAALPPALQPPPCPLNTYTCRSGQEIDGAAAQVERAQAAV